MRRGEVWWARLAAPSGRRPVVLVSHDAAYAVRGSITVAPVTTRVRRIPVEVPLGAAEGLPRNCVVDVDSLVTIPKRDLESLAGSLGPTKRVALDRALKFALGLDG